MTWLDAATQDEALRMTESYDGLLYLDAYRRADVVRLLDVRTPDEEEALFARADSVRRAHVGDTVHLRGIIEISNICDCACLYCGLRAQNDEVARYRMDPDEIIERAALVAALPVRTIVLQSGESETYSTAEIVHVVHTLKTRHDVAVTLSLGVRDEATLRAWREAGADRYLLKHETANRALFRKIKPGVDFASRLEALRTLVRLGFQAGSGNMIGIPDQRLDDIADDILLCRDLRAGMTTFGPFIPNPDTPLRDASQGSVSLALRTIAAARIVLRSSHIPANTALGTADADAQRRAFACGANVLMPNFTPLKYRKQYRIYPKKLPDHDDVRRIYDTACALVASTGRSIDGGHGHAVR